MSIDGIIDHDLGQFTAIPNNSQKSIIWTIGRTSEPEVRLGQY
jgi:hypothetical protein